MNGWPTANPYLDLWSIVKNYKQIYLRTCKIRGVADDHIAQYAVQPHPPHPIINGLKSFIRRWVPVQ